MASQKAIRSLEHLQDSSWVKNQLSPNAFSPNGISPNFNKAQVHYELALIEQVQGEHRTAI